MIQTVHITTYSLVKTSLEGADIVIEPEVAHIGAGEFHHAPELIFKGELAAQKAVPEIKRQIAIL